MSKIIDMDKLSDEFQQFVVVGYDDGNPYVLSGGNGSEINLNHYVLAAIATANTTFGLAKELFADKEEHTLKEVRDYLVSNIDKLFEEHNSEGE